jgi:hypothetical protein
MQKMPIQNGIAICGALTAYFADLFFFPIQRQMAAGGDYDYDTFKKWERAKFRFNLDWCDMSTNKAIMKFVNEVDTMRSQEYLTKLNYLQSHPYYELALSKVRDGMCFWVDLMDHLIGAGYPFKEVRVMGPISILDNMIKVADSSPRIMERHFASRVAPVDINLKGFLQAKRSRKKRTCSKRRKKRRK